MSLADRRLELVFIMLASCGGTHSMPAGEQLPSADGATLADLGSPAARLSWDAPTTYTDGSALTVAGYHVYYGTMSGAYGMPVDVGNQTSYAFATLPPATYYFAVTAYDDHGTESMLSTEKTKVIP